jgi:hypothetical protein
MTLQALPGNIPRAAWQWLGKISRQQFDSVPFILRDKAVQGETCQHCTFVLRYKVLAGQLYTDTTRRWVDTHSAAHTVPCRVLQSVLSQHQCGCRTTRYDGFLVTTSVTALLLSPLCYCPPFAAASPLLLPPPLCCCPLFAAAPPLLLPPPASNFATGSVT